MFDCQENCTERHFKELWESVGDLDLQRNERQQISKVLGL